MLSDQTIVKLQVILKEEYGKETTKAEASEIAYTLVGYFDALTKAYYKQLKNNNNDNDNKTNNA